MNLKEKLKKFFPSNRPWLPSNKIFQKRIFFLKNSTFRSATGFIIQAISLKLYSNLTNLPGRRMQKNFLGCHFISENIEKISKARKA